VKDNQKTLREIGVSCEIQTTYLLNSRSIALPFDSSCWVVVVVVVVVLVVVVVVVVVVTVELHSSGLTGTASHPDMQRIRITGFSLKIGYICSLKWKIISSNSCNKLHIYLRTNKTLIQNSLHVFDKWGEKFKP
jgi:hypothetical protein